MASNLPMGAQLEQIYGEIRDHFRALANGFQRLDKIKDSTRQSKQLEELTDKMRECKRLVKEFDRELKDEEARNSPQLNKQLNDEKQSVIKELNSYVALRKTYMTTLGNKKVELFDMGAGVSGEPTAEENVQVASAMSNQELVDAGMKRMDETDQAIERSKQVVEQTLEVGTQIAANLKGQTDQMGRVVNHLDTIQFCRSAVVVSRRLRFQNMGVEEDTKVTRRSSRLSSSVTLENPQPIESHPPTLDDLVFGQEPITVDALLSAFPGRRSQILDLVRLMGPLDSPTLPIMLYGGPSTGKTTLVLHLFNHLHRPFVYSSCRTCYTPRILFESILNQLLLHSKSSSNGYSSSKRCDKPSDFVNLLRQALTNVIDNLHSTSGKPMGKMVYLILDNVDLIRDWDKGSMILHFLFSLSSVLKMPQLGIILISGLPPDVYYSNMGYTYPVPLYFPEYSEEDLRQIFLRNQPNQKLYSAFLDVVLRPFFRVTRRVDQLSNTFSSLFRKFCEPLDDLGISPNEDMKRRLFGHLKPLIAPSLNEIFRVRSHPYDDERQQKASYGSENHGELEILDLHMSTSAKFLLIAAFLASRNPATLDASMFDSTGGIDNRKRKRKASEKSMEKKEIAEQEAAMKGPGSFPLERLLAIFQCIASVGDSSFGEEDGEEEEATGYEKEDNNLMSDILLQVSSLCDANFIIKSGSCPLEGSVRYRSMVSEDLAQKVARSLSFPLSKYLYRR